MNRVLDRLWIGDATDLDGGPPLEAVGFSGVVDLRDRGREASYHGVEVFCLTNRDGDPWTGEEIDRALGFVAERIRAGHVLVACAAGMSRSASLVIGYLVRTGWDLPSALARVREARPRVSPVPDMLRAVVAAAMGVGVDVGVGEVVVGASGVTLGVVGADVAGARKVGP